MSQRDLMVEFRKAFIASGAALRMPSIEEMDTLYRHSLGVPVAAMRIDDTRRTVIATHPAAATTDGLETMLDSLADTYPIDMEDAVKNQSAVELQERWESAADRLVDLARSGLLIIFGPSYKS